MSDQEIEMEFQAQGMKNSASDQPAAPHPVKHLASSYDRRVQIAAARLLIICDQRLGNVTPEWIQQLAAEKTVGDDW